MPATRTRSGRLTTGSAWHRPRLAEPRLDEHAGENAIGIEVLLGQRELEAARRPPRQPGEPPELVRLDAVAPPRPLDRPVGPAPAADGREPRLRRGLDDRPLVEQHGWRQRAPLDAAGRNRAAVPAD